MHKPFGSLLTITYSCANVAIWHASFRKTFLLSLDNLALRDFDLSFLHRGLGKFVNVES